MKRKNHKRYFQLLEIMIALFLVAVCAFPVVRSYVDTYKNQRKLGQTLELDHLAYLAHAKIVEDLYFKGAKGESLKECLGRKISVREMDPQLLKDCAYDFFYQLDIERPKAIKKQETAERLLLALKLEAIKKDDPKKETRTYDYKLCIVRPENVVTPEQKNPKKDAKKTDD